MRARRITAWVAIVAAGLTFRIGIVPEARASVFVQNGWGWWWDEGTAAALGRGGTSVAVTGYGVTGALNPAVMAGADPAYGLISYSGEITNAKGDSRSYRQRSDLLPSIGGIVSLPGGVRAGLLFRVQTDAGYDRLLRYDHDEAGPYSVRIQGSGGLHRYQLGLSRDLFRGRLSTGAAVSRIQGTVRETVRYDFTSPSQDVREITEARFRGGWQESAGILVRPVPALSIGGAVQSAGSGRLIQEVTGLEGSLSGESITGRQELPPQWALGAHLMPVRRFSMSADLIRTLWSRAGLEPGGDARESHPFRDTTRWGFGVEFFPGLSPKVPWVIRAGYSSSTHHVREIVSGNRIVERTGSVGVRRMMAKGRSALDLALEAGKRGDRAEAGVEERFVRLSLGIAFSSPIREY